MNKCLSVIKKMTNKDWVQVIFWMITLLMLFTFVIVAAIGKTHAASMSKNSNAIAGLLFAISLSSSILITVFIKFFEKRKVVK